MRRALAKKESLLVRPAVRSGRPPRKLAGEVDTRILDAARELFFERGLAGASMDEIASRARAGKPTVYNRFPTKEALFTAVVMRSVADKIAQFENYVPTGETVEERLASVGETVLRWVFVGDTIGLMRLAIAEARRFPELASSVHRMALERATEAVARLLGEAAQSDEFGTLSAFAPDRLATTTASFVDLVVMPLIIEALFGEKLETLCTEIGPHVARTVAFFLAACRYDARSKNKDDQGRTRSSNENSAVTNKSEAAVAPREPILGRKTDVGSRPTAPRARTRNRRSPEHVR
jgi:AcrR family transcriptional regulator